MLCSFTVVCQRVAHLDKCLFYFLSYQIMHFTCIFCTLVSTDEVHVGSQLQGVYFFCTSIFCTPLHSVFSHMAPFLQKMLPDAKRKQISKSDCNWTRTQNHLVLKRTLNHLAKLVWISVWIHSEMRT